MTSLPMMLSDRGDSDEDESRTPHNPFILVSCKWPIGRSGHSKVITGDLTRYETALARESNAGPNS